MTTLQTLIEKNPNLDIRSVQDKTFKAFGQLITGHDFSELTKFCVKSYYDANHSGLTFQIIQSWRSSLLSNR
ncbi:hypothetical protein JCM19239_2008 [Vibrio variabilis]|uniref:Uncharacterized protein n=1 Tax=Vibrio variabilis TaxID=990271 RepID=A0ABQ0J707_9VIBR|nr:hypothetical protein JCM19239_2008 [Vibrio variabilis]